MQQQVVIGSDGHELLAARQCEALHYFDRAREGDSEGGSLIYRIKNQLPDMPGIGGERTDMTIFFGGILWHISKDTAATGYRTAAIFCITVKVWRLSGEWLFRYYPIMDKERAKHISPIVDHYWPTLDDGAKKEMTAVLRPFFRVHFEAFLRMDREGLLGPDSPESEGDDRIGVANHQSV